MPVRWSVACCATALRGEHAGSTRRNSASGLVHTPGASLTTTSALAPCSEEFLLPPVHRCPCLLCREGRLGWEELLEWGENGQRRDRSISLVQYHCLQHGHEDFPIFFQETSHKPLLPLSMCAAPPQPLHSHTTYHPTNTPSP